MNSGSESFEMYLETIYLLEKMGGEAHTVDIASRLNISKPSVSKAMKGLKEKGYIEKEDYGSIKLTKKGLGIAKEVYSKHVLLTEFFEKSLGLDEEEATINACKAEHIITDKAKEAVIKYLENYSNEH